METGDNPGFHCELLHEGRLVIYTIENAANTTIDGWMEAIKAFRDRWQSDEPYYSLQDVSHENMSITPYARQRWEEIRAYRTERKLYAAIVLPKTFVANLIQLHFRTSKVRSGAKFRFFTSRDDALAWLEWLLESKI